jgi:hypothetical protein
MDALAVHELAHLGEDPHALVAEKKIDKRFAAVGTRRLVTER